MSAKRQQRRRRWPTKVGSGGAPPAAALAPANGREALGTGAFCVEVGAVRIYAESAADVRAVLEPLLQMTSQKNLAQMLGVSTRTLQRWQRAGRVPVGGGHLLSQVVDSLGTRTGSGP